MGIAGLLARLTGRPANIFDGPVEEPIREELFSIDHLSQYAAQRAAEHQITTEPQRGRKLLPRLRENGRLLVSAYGMVADAIRQGRAISPAAEWLVDNFHIVEEQLREIREDLPRSYYYELPKLASGKLAGYPRVYAIALGLIAHTDSRLDVETLRRYIQSYQQVTPLTTGELWAVAITLRLALVENLRRLALRIAASRREREMADKLADELLVLAERQPKQCVSYAASKLEGIPHLGGALVAQLAMRLRDQDLQLASVLEWLNDVLKKQDRSIDDLVAREHQRQAAAQVTVGNIITSMRLLSTLDWRAFFEGVSVVDQVLGSDPAGVYSRMNFVTRDRYRHVVERISKRSRADELEVARAAVQLASADHSGSVRPQALSHVGYYLVDQGLETLEEKFGYVPNLGERLRRTVLQHPAAFYLGSLAITTVLILILVAVYSVDVDAGIGSIALAMLLVLIPAIDLAVSNLNWDITHIFTPRLLAQMDFATGIQPDASTIVVVPTLLTDEDTVRSLIEKMEIHYLANRDEHIYLALLGDFADAGSETLAEDRLILEAASTGVELLNSRYADQNQAPRFYLFHRVRQWNESEGKWMGWERKRGKLQEFNRVLRGARDTSFIETVEPGSTLSTIRYVITLDSDTRLPRDAARNLIGIAAHPLNHPYIDPAVGRVTQGYGILQPRVGVSLESGSKTRFARIFSGSAGIDPYTTATSDVYQDLFYEGSFTGKGLYEVDAFEGALAARVPENRILSHDLLEGVFARAALVSDVEVIDDYPAHYDTFAKRQHRWTRGDWQIAQWIASSVPDESGKLRPNPISMISRWKILDNLRRSLLAPAMVLLLIAGWSVLPGSPLFWTGLVLVAVAFPIFAHAATSLLVHPRGISWSRHFRTAWNTLWTNIIQVGLTLVFLAHQAYLMVDAILRTLYRQLVSGKRLLEWVTAAQDERGSPHDQTAFWRFMAPLEPIVVLATGLILWRRPEALIVASPWLIAWIVSPMIATWVSRRIKTGPRELPASDNLTARLVARRTWRFFETFVGADDHWLPPDNYQEDPRPAIAHRTSPTNIGLLLLSTSAAYNFGYIGSLELIERLELTFATFARMPKFRGHFLNWYDTTTLDALSPQYVSTVDSGNMAGHLIALKQACLAFVDRPLFDQRVIDGVTDTIAMMNLEASKLVSLRQSTGVATIKELREEITGCVGLLMADDPESLSHWAGFFEGLNLHALVIEDMINALSHEHGGEKLQELRFWCGALLHQVRSFERDLHTLAPWGNALTSHLSPVISQCSVEIAGQWAAIGDGLARVYGVSRLPDLCDDGLVRLAALRAQIEQSLPESTPNRGAAINGLTVLTGGLEAAASASSMLLRRVSSLAQSCETIIAEMDFRFLLDPERKVFVIGYNVTDSRVDNSFYDLLASESRLASFVAVAKGEAPQEHWFRLGRQITEVDGGRALISWTATMFEYLMPLLVMRDYPETLLSQTYHSVVRRQIEYGSERRVPWGVSESAYNARDLQLNYQYGPFGIPGLGLKRGLSEDLVISPYSTLLAALVDPVAALGNLRRLEQEGLLGRYGFYESVDYTPERLPQDQKSVVIRAFMAHHQGMSLVSLDNLLHDNIMQEHFHAEPLVQATELLLQERIPHGVPVAHPRAEEVLSGRMVRSMVSPVTRTYDSPSLASPQTQLLSNGVYNVMITTAGGGYSNCGPLAVTRWREDATRDNWGSFCYLRDVRSGALWSTGYQPIVAQPQFYQAIFSENQVEFHRQEAGITTVTEIIVSPEDNAEMRRVTVKNTSTRIREIELTTYSEIVLATAAADVAHPAFSNLFIETEFIQSENALLAHRRPRSQSDKPVWAFHTVVVIEGEDVGTVQYETDRSRFLGRGRTVSDPVAVVEDRPLSKTVGAVLDPIFSLRQRIRLQPGETARIAFAIGIADSREAVLALADKYNNPNTYERESMLAWTRSQVEMRHLSIEAEEAHLFQRLASRILYLDPSLRPRSHVLSLNSETQSALWAYGISGDIPIVLGRIGERREVEGIRQLLRAHQYLRLKGLVFDLVILNDHEPTYMQSLQDTLQSTIRATGAQGLIDQSGGIFLRRTDIMPEADRILLHAAARVVIVTDRGPLEEQIMRRAVEEPLPPAFVQRSVSRAYPEPQVPMPDTMFFNGLGGFSHGGREYFTRLYSGQWTPAPWTNVIANSHEFGFLVTESGGGYTWSANSRENRLTPWSNDSVSDAPGEVFYLRDEDTGTVWTPTPLPIREDEPYLIRHGQGYSVFEHTSHGIQQELLLFVPLDAPVKITILRLRNLTDRPRRISLTSYQEVVLGVWRERSAQFVITEVNADTGAIFARNPYNNEFASRVCVAQISAKSRTFTCDRKEFIGRNGVLSDPDAMRRTQLSGKSGAGFDPCIAMRTSFELAPGASREVVVLLGQGDSREHASEIAERYALPSAANQAFEKVVNYWDEVLGRIEVRTPDEAMDTMLNRWLLYQALSCRVWARTAFYQSGGAYGFRDQLQDVCALVYSEPGITRAQILIAAAHQFKEGDVQHWWHPPTGRGVRTRISDDLLWLPFVATFYVEVTGDTSVLDEVVPFLEAPILAEGQDESYLQPTVSTETGSVFEHCIRAIDRSLKVGEHGLPLMGNGDWNDGMNRVGPHGKGESVWVGWFLYSTLNGFADHCEARKEKVRATRYRKHMEKLKKALEENAWDGDWYLRAYFDDGTPLGSERNEECRIDSIVQSWGVISGAADRHRATRAMASVEEYLIRRGEGLVILFTPPFDKSNVDPGYIKGYVPGVRENGGQYTHAALWTLIAYAALGDGDRAGELFSLLNPINHSSTRAGLHKYKVEPYVTAGDVYAVWPHSGRGGWTWYTGSASWMYRAGLESMLGFRLRGATLRMEPCIPRGWREFTINYKFGTSSYRIHVTNPHGVSRGVESTTLDGTPQSSPEVELVDDGRVHQVEIMLGEQSGDHRSISQETEGQIQS